MKVPPDPRNGGLCLVPNEFAAQARALADDGDFFARWMYEQWDRPVSPVELAAVLCVMNRADGQHLDDEVELRREVLELRCELQQLRHQLDEHVLT